MIHSKGIKYVPTPPTIDKSLTGVFDEYIAGLRGHRQEDTTFAIKLFAVFLDCTGHKFSYMSLNKDQTAVVRCFVGFVYQEMNYTNISSNRVVFVLREAFMHACDLGGLVMPQFPTTQSHTVTKDVTDCCQEYATLEKDAKAYRFYVGWKTKSKTGEEIAWPLHGIYRQYGEELADRIYEAALAHSRKYRPKTVRTDASQFARLLETILELCPTREHFEDAGSFTRINRFVEHLFAAQKLAVKESGESMGNFYKKWRGVRIRLITELLIKPGIWSEPCYELFAPLFKTSPTHSNTNKGFDEKGNAFNNKLVTHIPISFSDDEAIKALLESIDSDYSHVVSACQKLREKTMAGYHRRKALANVGKVKRENARGTYPGHPDFVDMRLPENQCATYEAIKYQKTIAAASYLKVVSKDFINEYAVLAPYTLYPFLYLLINEHPEITQSWLENWRLYDSSGKEYGFVRSGDSYIATSYKYRKGAISAEQKIILNEISIQLVRDIIMLTSDARNTLKERDSADYKYMLIKARGFMPPSRVKNLVDFSEGGMILSEMSNKILEPSSYADAEKAGAIVRNLSLSSFRASRAVLVYLKTKSTKAMSEALGHVSYQPKLLSHYLPTPILSYFQARWVRVFQNALVYEAMKDSDYLFDAVDFSEDELDGFLRNHRLKPLPEHLINGEFSDLFVERKDGSASIGNLEAEGIIPVSVPVLSVMNTLVDLVESASATQRITSAASNWYETSKFVLSYIRTDLDCSRELIEALERADKKPLPKGKLKGAIYVA